MNNTILVIGAIGNLGGVVMRQLVAKESRVRIGVCKFHQYQAASSQVEVVRFDFDGPTSYSPAMENIEKLLGSFLCKQILKLQSKLTG